MDAYDIFKKLSRGAIFTKKNHLEKLEPNDEPPKVEPPSNPVKIKKEKVLDESVTILSSFAETTPKKRKREPDTPEELERKNKLLKQEEVNHYRNLQKISVVGKKCPHPDRSFDDFQIDKDLKDNLCKCGYTEPTPIQQQAVPILLQNRNLLACAPTGSGKTAAFLVPLIQDLKGPQKSGFRALIICPTRELAKQTQRECVRLSEGRGFRIHIISKINKALAQYGQKSSQKYDILITTPNRVCFLLNQEPPAISLANVQYLVIDEADKLFEEGNRGFRDQLTKILSCCTRSEKKIAMFSATHTPAVAKWCVRNMKGLLRITVGQRNAATNLVHQELLFVGNEQGKLLAFRDLIKKGLRPPVLVFVQSKDRAQQLFNELIYDGISVDAIHADRTQLQRDNTVRSFREGHVWVLICTELMARGIDFKGVNLVINYDFPPSAISYVHRVGRAGRAGRKGKAITFFTIEDSSNLRSIAHVLKESGCKVPNYMLSINKKRKKGAKSLVKGAPRRDDINTKPKYQIFQEMKRRKEPQEKTEKIKKEIESKELAGAERQNIRRKKPNTAAAGNNQKPDKKPKK